MRPRINNELDSSTVHLIDETGKSFGEVVLDQALYLAYEKNVDLVEINPKSSPPIAKLIDVGKYQYDQQKKAAKQKGHQKGGELKEVRLSLRIEQHDFETKARRAKGFLDQGDKVRVSVILKGRENIFPERATDTINRFAEIINAKIDQQPNRLGNRIIAILSKSN